MKFKFIKQDTVTIAKIVNNMQLRIKIVFY